MATDTLTYIALGRKKNRTGLVEQVLYLDQFEGDCNFVPCWVPKNREVGIVFYPAQGGASTSMQVNPI